MRLAVTCYFNNSLLPATPTHAKSWEPDRHSVARIRNWYVPGDTLVRSSISIVYDEDSGAGEELVAERACDHLFSMLNRDDRPNGATERSMSAGDLARVDGGSLTRWYACEDLGWKRVAPPRKENIRK